MSINATRRQSATPDEIKKAVCDAIRALSSADRKVTDASIAKRAAGRIGISESVVRKRIVALSPEERTQWGFPEEKHIQIAPVPSLNSSVRMGGRMRPIDFRNRRL